MKGKWRESGRPLPSTAWAWEYLRRNSAFRDIWRQTAHLYDDIRWIDQFRVVRLTTELAPAQRSACLYASSPDEDALHAAIIWRPEHHASVLRVIAVPIDIVPSARPFRAQDIGLPAILLQTSDGLQHLSFRDGPRSLQLLVRGASLLEPVALLLDTLILDPPYSEHEEASASCLRDLRKTGRIAKEYCPEHRLSRRLAGYLRALDCHLAGATQSEIATTLFGPEEASDIWSDPHNHIRNRVRYAVEKGRALSEYGHLKLVR